MNTNPVKEGWKALHFAALSGGAEWDEDPSDCGDAPGERYVDGEIYAALVWPMLDLAGIDPESYGGRESEFFASVWRWIRQTARRDAPDHWMELSALTTARSVYGAYADRIAGKRSRGAPKFSASVPLSAVRTGHWLIRNQQMHGIPGRTIVPILWGLALIGAAWSAHLRSTYCELCFRRSRPGSRFCDWHSQGACSDGERSAAYIRYRQARRVRALIEERCLERVILPDPLQRATADQLILPNLLSPMRATGDQSQDHAFIRVALRSCPRVVKVLGGKSCLSLSADGIHHLLMERLDPNEWSFGAWCHKISAAEQWLALEQEVSPGHRGRGHKTSQKVDQAIVLARSGETNVGIARRLGVSASTVSRWAERYPAFARVCAQRSLRTSI